MSQFPTPPTAPSLSDPANFDTRTDAFLAWMTTIATQWNSTEPYIQGDAAIFASIFSSTDLRASSSLSASNMATSTTEVGLVYQQGNLFVVNRNSAPPATFNRLGTTGTNLVFRHAGASVGSVSVTASATAYNTSSDYRLKENITPIQGAADIVKAMKPCTYTFKSDGSWHDGFIAHELQEFHPRAVIGEKDAVDADGFPDYQGLDYSKLTPILTAALQEAFNKIDDLEARLTALEAV